MATGDTTPSGEIVTFSTPAAVVSLQGVATQDALHAATLRALEQRRYTIVSDDGTHIVARLESRHVALQLGLELLGTDSVQIAYLESTGLPIESPVASRRYTAWMRELNESLTDEADRPRRDAEEAARHAEEEARHAREQQEQQAREAAEQQARVAQQTSAAQGQPAAGAPATGELRLPTMTFTLAQAQSAPGVIVLRPGWTDTAYDGVAGGPVTGASMGLPPVCAGFFQALPQHTMVLAADAGRITLTVQAPGPTALLVVGSNGVAYCEPSGTFSRGLSNGAYRIYVGNVQSPQPTAYRMAVAQQAIDGVSIRVEGINVQQDLTHVMGQ